MDPLNRPNKPLLNDLRRIFGDVNPRTLRAFEDLFEAVPGDLNSLISDIEALDIRVTQNEADIAAIEDFIFKVIQFKSVGYALLETDSGIVSSSASTLSHTIADASLWTDQNKFIQNTGTGPVFVIPFTGQQISGVDLIILAALTPYVTVNLKSDGSNLILLSDRSDDAITSAFYWVDETGDQMVDETGDELIFVI